ncbi:MAG: hypothetical protein M1830_008037 [Pleopsidium flavum]|nr:MAG: hypothetical protein M1830_008037 [Pleopsidium flavum]
MFANVVCDPPLGQTTVIPAQQQTVTFTVLVESGRSFPEPGWEVALWHNFNESKEWEELYLKEVPSNVSPLTVNNAGLPAVHRHYFSAELFAQRKVLEPYHFTVKFRLKSTETWKWVNDQLCKANGEIYFQPPAFPGGIPSGNLQDSRSHYDKLSTYINDLGWGLTVKRVASETPDAKLWIITGKVDGPTTYGAKEYPLGKPSNFSRWFSLVRIWTPWLAPRHGKGDFTTTEDAVLCSFLRWDGLNLVLLAVSGIDDILTVLKCDKYGGVVVSSRKDSRGRGEVRIIAAVGKTFESANAAAMYHARKMIAGMADMSAERSEKEIKPKWLENWYDGLTYCTWNGLGQDLTEKKIYDAVDILEKNDISVTNLIIDDNWQSLDNHGQSQFKRGWTDFEANKEGFPLGLKHTVSQIRSKHPNIQHIAVWHALFGYWGGISPEGKIAKGYKTKEVRKKDGIAGGTFTVVDADDAPQMYDDFYKFLSSAGIDSVKTDAQFFLDLLDDDEDRRRFITAYQDAWTVPASHPWHIFTNAHNSLLTQHLNILPDWDMFQTSHPYSSFHAAGRCVSGGPIYITDEPGRHDIDLIRQMTAPNPRGKTVILRPMTIGKTVHAYVSYDEERLLRVGTFTGSKATGTGILGIFNVSQRSLSDLVPLREFPGIEEDGSYVIRAHSTGEISNALKPGDKLALVLLDVAVKGWEILSSYPLQSFTLKGSRGLQNQVTKVAVLGLLGKMTGAAAVINSDIYIESNGRLRIWTSLKALGVLGIFISDLATRSIEESFMIMILGEVIPFHTVRASKSNKVLEIDIERAWKELGLSSGWSNEVAVDVFID